MGISILPLFLAVPDQAYKSIEDDAVRNAFKQNGVKLVVIDIEREESDHSSSAAAEICPAYRLVFA